MTNTPLQNAIIYYWQKKPNDLSSSIKDYNALARFRRRKTDLRAIFSFLFYTLLIGIIAGLISGVFVARFAPTPAASPPGTAGSTVQFEPGIPKPSVPPIPTKQKSTSG